MPINLPNPVRRLSQAEFGELAYSVMGRLFEIHGDLGCFFDEKIYKRELAYRCPAAVLEFPIETTFDTFRKLQYIDVLVAGGGPFEIKTVDIIKPRHVAQLLHYMLLTELAHGKLVNLGKTNLHHEFVNTTLRHEDRIRFRVADANWNDHDAGAEPFRELLTALLRDWGTGLDLLLYEEAVAYLLGGEMNVPVDITVRTHDHTLGHQKMRLASQQVAFALTALTTGASDYELHSRRLLQHTELDAILWANITLKLVTFTTIKRQKY